MLVGADERDGRDVVGDVDADAVFVDRHGADPSHDCGPLGSPACHPPRSSTAPASSAGSTRRSTRTTRGDGALILLEGPAGIGKTALLRAAREEARGHGVLTLSAVASALDRDFPFGLVHQLLGPGARPGRRGRAGPAARRGRRAGRAGPVADRRSRPAARPGLRGPPRPVLARREPRRASSRSRSLVDDLHWADRASLRWLEYLGRRLDGVRSRRRRRSARPSPAPTPRCSARCRAARAPRPSTCARCPARRSARSSPRRSARAPDAEFADARHHRHRRQPAAGPRARRGRRRGGADRQARRGRAGRRARPARARAGHPAPPAGARRRRAHARPRRRGPRRARLARGPRDGRRPRPRPGRGGRRPPRRRRAPRGRDVGVRPPARPRGGPRRAARRQRAALHQTAATRLAQTGAPPGEIAVHLLATEPGNRPAVAATLRPPPAAPPPRARPTSRSPSCAAR